MSSTGAPLAGSSDTLDGVDPLETARKASVHGSQQPLYKFVLTGGPCGGKTTALERMGEHFRDQGFQVYMVPEAATMLFVNGVSLQDLDDPEVKFAFQWSVLRLQIQLEDNFERVARAKGRPAVLLCDRGLLDGAAYLEQDMWERLLRDNKLDVVGIRDGRYNAIFHLVTAANGAEQHYSLDNNVARSEPVELAIQVDLNTQRVWMGHPHHYVFDNSCPDFDTKIARVISTASRFLGLPGLERGVTKFVLEQSPDLSAFPVPYREFEVEKVHLVPADPPAPPTGLGRQGVQCCSSHAFVRKRSQNGFSAYGVTNVFNWQDGTRTESKRIITGREYDSLVQHSRDPARRVVRQRRVSFLWEHQSFVVHSYLEPVSDVHTLHCQTEGGAVKLPPFLRVREGLGAEDRYSSYHIARV